MSTAKIFILLWLSLLLFAAPTQAQQTPDSLTQILNRLTVEEKVGQLFIVPFVGSTANPGADIYQLITEYKVGGVVLLAANSNFENNPSAPRQITELNNTLKTTAFQTNGLPLFVAIDHEGDNYPYTRITGGVAAIPSQMAIGATWNTSNAEGVGQIVGEELSAMGINMLLGPGLDVLNDPRPTGRGDIGTRVFGGDPYWVGQMGRAYIRGVHHGSGGKIVTVAKHFPGHGGSDRLPDAEVATVDKSLQELRRIELPPFFFVTTGRDDDPWGLTDALMSSHIRYRGFQGDIRQFTAPISFDAEGMQTLLNLPEIDLWRSQGGVIVSDALGVEAVRKHFDPSRQSFPHRRIAKEAFLAGNDILLLDQFAVRSVWQDQFPNIKDTIFFFRTEYNNNPTFARQVDEAVERILRLKLKLYPELTEAALQTDPNQVQNVTGQARPITDDIARQSLTLLYPSPSELRVRLPEPPRPTDKILIVNDSRFTRVCYASNCEPQEVYIPRTALQEIILRLYGPQATGQIQPENINTITFSELKLALGGSLTPAIEPAVKAEAAENRAVQLSVDEVRDQIQVATWIIFASLDLNLDRYPDSDALKLFLSQEGGLLRDKTSIVLAFNAPYYLDTTEVTKLTAFFGVFSKTQPHLEAAVRAIFGETEPLGASPVSVESIGYNLADALAPDPDQDLSVELLGVSPENRLVPVTARVRIGPIVDHNGRPIPDGTPVEVKGLQNGSEITAATAVTSNGMAEAALILRQPGETEIVAVASQVVTSAPIQVTVLAEPTPTSMPVVATPTQADEALPTDEPIPTPSPTPLPTSEPTPTPGLPLPFEPNPAEPLALEPRQIDGADLFLALAATLLAGILGFWLGRQSHRPLSQQVSLSLWVLIGGLIGYLFYGVGWIRPEQWAFETPGVWVGRLSVAALAFICGLAAMGLTGLLKTGKT
jgi:beta-N-acetylhexosaminidase